MEELHKLVSKLQEHVRISQNNLQEIRNALVPFARQPLYERREGHKDCLLCIEDKEDRIGRRYREIEKATENIKILVNENMQLFGMAEKSNDARWIEYVNYIDNLVLSYLYQTIGCR